MKDIKKVGIVGAGTMGRRLVYGCIISGKQTRLFDILPKAPDEARQVVRALIEERMAEGRLVPGTLEAALPLLSICSSLEDCVSGVDLVIETVPEDIALKRKVFAEIDQYSDPDTLIGTNTSSIPGSKLADATKRPEKVFNFNFGPPDDLKVEVMGHPLTDQSTIERAMKFVKSLGLVPILVRREIMGYAGNRVWRAVKKEVLFLLDGGFATAEDIDRGWMLEWETPIGPCGLMDIIGLDVVRDIEMVYYAASGDPSDQPPKMLLDMIEQGKLGVKSGEGFYKYPDPAYKRPSWLKGEESPNS
ncbi:MAG: 3-hydroxyacyl-CoA dehydrogenase family protein [Candidatus Aminicenantes bacterium]|nr:MAG: 3-hydroxyacyl-CoA dehydrogenase family protein [Candidatus Aminicenantes bacterium]